jgi:hypothetical protein
LRNRQVLSRRCYATPVPSTTSAPLSAVRRGLSLGASMITEENGRYHDTFPP